MFGLGLKERTSEALRRGGYALMIGNFVDKSLIDESDFNDDAGSLLYFRALAHCVFSLFVAYDLSVARGRPWANIDFFVESIGKGFAQYEREERLPQGMLIQEVGPTFVEIGAMHGGGDFAFTARLVAKVDPDSDEVAIEKFLSSSVERYFASVKGMFTEHRRT